MRGLHDDDFLSLRENPKIAKAILSDIEKKFDEMRGSFLKSGSIDE